MKKLFSFYPVHTLHTWHQTEVLDIVSNNCQTIVKCSRTNQHVKLADFFVQILLYLFQCATNLAVFFKHVTNIVYLNITTQPLRFLDMTFVITTVDCTICQFGQCHLRSTKIRSTNGINVFRYAITFMEILNPRTGVKNILFHQSSRLISRINSFLRPSLMAASIRAASSGSSFQHPHKLLKSRSFSSSVSSGSTASSLDSAKDSVKNIITIFFSSRLIPCSKLEYGAIGVSNSFFAIAVILNSFLFLLQS